MDNAQFVERVRNLCKSQKTSLTKLEAQLGFSNGYIGKWSKRPSSPPHDKIVEIADALGVTVEELTGEEPGQKKEPDRLLPAGLDTSGMSKEQLEILYAVSRTMQESEDGEERLRHLLKGAGIIKK